MAIFKRYRGKKLTNAKDPNWNKGTWYIWRRINGKIIHKALKDAKTKEQAEAAERKIIERAFNQRYGIADTTTSFTEFADGPYTRYVKQKNVSITTKLQYIKLLTAFFKKQILTTITPQDCRDCQTAMKKKGYSASSVNGIMSTASKLFTLACQEGIMDRNPMQFVPRLQEPPPRHRILSQKEKEKLWEVLGQDVLMLRLVLLAVNLPLRRGQLLAITETAIDFQNGLLSVIGSKGRGARFVPLNSGAMSTLQAMIEDGQLPFPLKETGLRKRFVRALKKAEIENFRFHDLRHVFGTELARNNVHLKTIQDLYAHSDPRVTSIYINPTFNEMAEAVKTLDILDSEVIQ